MNDFEDLTQHYMEKLEENLSLEQLEVLTGKLVTLLEDKRMEAGDEAIDKMAYDFDEITVDIRACTLGEN